MPTSYTTLLGFALPVTGDLSSTWGAVVNTSITELLDTAIAGTTTLNTDADVTLTTTTGAANQARAAVLNCTGARTAARTVTAPAASKAYVVVNGTTGGYAVNLVGVGPTTGISIAAGEKALVAWNGSDFVKVSSTVITNLTGTLAVANGGTGVTTSTGSGNTVLSTSPTLVTPALGTPASGVLTNATGLPLTTGVTGTLPVANGGTGVTTSTGSGNTVLSTSPTLVTPALGTPASGVLTNATGLPLTTGVTGTLPVANGGTGQTSYTDGQLLIGNSSGNTLTKTTLTAGANVTVTNGGGSITIAATGGGTVTSASVVSANGFAGSVASATTTPAITLTTSVTGLLKGNGTAVSAAVAGTDYLSPGGALLVQEQQSSLTNSSSTSLTDSARVLNTVVSNTITGASLASNQITLAAGTYDIVAICPAHRAAGVDAVYNHRATLYDTTNTATLLIGAVAAVSTTTNVGGSSTAVVHGRFTLSGGAVLEVRHNSTGGSANGGQAGALGTNVYASVAITKV